MSSPASTTSPTPSPSPRVSLNSINGLLEKPFSRKQFQDRNTSFERADSTTTTGVATPSPPSGRVGWSTANTTQRMPMHERVLPPTMEELEEMDRAKRSGWDEAEGCVTPAASCASSSSAHQDASSVTRSYSRQVSRVSGTGRPSASGQQVPSMVAPTKVRTPARESLRCTPQRMPAADICEVPVRPPKNLTRTPREEPGPRPRPNLRRRSSSADALCFDTRRPTQYQQQQPQRAYAPLVADGARVFDQRPNPVAANGGVSTGVRRGPGGTARQLRDLEMSARAPQQQQSQLHQQHQQRGTRAQRGPTPSAQATPAFLQDGPREPAQPNDGGAFAARRGGSGDLCNGSTTGGVGRAATAATALRRRNSAPDFSSPDFAQVYEEMVAPVALQDAREQEERDGDRAESKSQDSSPSQAVWGGGLPPKRRTIAQGPPAARAKAARKPPHAERFAAVPRRPFEGRYPSTDRESFARTLNEEELEEVWRGLGEGVSQRGCDSEVAFDIGAPAGPPSPNGTTVSGAFPMLTATVLERHDLIAGQPGVVGHGGMDGGVNVMPLPKDIKAGNKALADMEAGTRSSKKSVGSSTAQTSSLLSAVVSCGVLVLWMAHLVFNAIMLWSVVQDYPVWGLCFVPGFFGILVSLRDCRRTYSCTPNEIQEEDSRARSGPHPCSLPLHLLLLVSIVVALGMHTSVILHCEKDMQLFLTADMVEPLCDDGSLLIPIILDGVLLSVGSLKASSLCWAWVLS